MAGTISMRGSTYLACPEGGCPEQLTCPVCQEPVCPEHGTAWGADGAYEQVTCVSMTEVIHYECHLQECHRAACWWSD